MKRRIALIVALTALVAGAAPAQANFHLMKIREIRAATSVPYVELQMYSPGQTFLSGHHVTTYDPAGAQIDDVPLTNVSGGQSQSTILIAPGPVEGVAPDITHSLGFSNSGGAVCFDAIPVDCVAYGPFTGAAMLPGAVGTPVTGFPSGAMALRRSIAPGCSTLLEAADDTDDSAADFALSNPLPRNNATAPTEVACGGDRQAPQTSISKGPKKKSSKTTAKFRFDANEPGVEFECKLDKDKAKACSSPQKYKHLDPGKHKFTVAATDDAGNTDPSPASYRFKVTERR